MAIVYADGRPLEPPPESPGLLGNWLAKVRAPYYALGPALANMQHRAAVIAAEANRSGDTFTHGVARSAVEGLGQLRLAWAETLDRFDDLAASIPGLGNVVVPVAYSAAAVAVAVAVWGIFRRATAQERIIGLLESGQLTPAEAAALQAEASGSVFGPALGGAAAAVALGVAALFFLGR